MECKCCRAIISANEYCTSKQHCEECHKRLCPVCLTNVADNVVDQTCEICRCWYLGRSSGKHSIDCPECFPIQDKERCVKCDNCFSSHILCGDCLYSNECNYCYKEQCDLCYLFCHHVQDYECNHVICSYCCVGSQCRACDVANTSKTE